MVLDVCCIFSLLFWQVLFGCVSPVQKVWHQFLPPSIYSRWCLLCGSLLCRNFLGGNCRSPTQNTLPISRCSWFLNTCGSAFHVGEASRESIPPQEVGIGDCLREEAGDEPWTRTCHRLLFLPLLSLLFFHHPHFLKISYKKLSKYFGFLYSLFLSNRMQNEPGKVERKVVLSFRWSYQPSIEGLPPGGIIKWHCGGSPFSPQR